MQECGEWKMKKETNKKVREGGGKEEEEEDRRVEVILTEKSGNLSPHKKISFLHLCDLRGFR